MKKIISLIFVALVSSLSSVLLYSYISKPKIIERKYTIEKPIAGSNIRNVMMPGIDLDLKTAAKRSVNAVVHIKKYEENTYSLADFVFGRHIPKEKEQVFGYGSGVIISPDGYIVTNHHVIENNSHIEVVLNNEESYIAKLIGTDPQTDIALLKIDGKNLPYLKYGNSDAIEIGDWVLAVGNPFNLTSTVTAGIVSAKARNLDMRNRSVDSFIQTDAAVNPGNSGGALVNVKGELIGINDLIYSRTGSYSGYSFAIPINVVQKVVKDLMEYGAVQRGFLGLSTVNLKSRQAKQLGMTATKGVGIAYLDKDFPAYKAGIKTGDIIIKINDIEIKDKGSMQEQLARFRPGDKVKITILRNGEEKNFDITLANQNGETKIIKTVSIESLGAVFEPVSKREKQIYGINGGVKIITLNAGKLRMEGVRTGFIILAVNRQMVKSAEDIKKIIDSTKEGGILIEGIYPNGTRAYYAIGLEK
jgi:Do/DeqQ family serine protease